MSEYRYQLERYRGRSTRYICPQCKRKHSFTRYIDTYNNNEYISDSVGKCNRIDKCGYHYTPKQYYTDNPWKRDTPPREEGSLRPCGYHYTPKQYFTDNHWKRDSGWWLVGRNDRVFDQPTIDQSITTSNWWLVGQNDRVFDQPTKTKLPQPPAAPPPLSPSGLWRGCSRARVREM